MWRFPLIAAQLAAATVILLTAVDYQQMAIRRHHERTLMRHLIGRLTPDFVGAIRATQPAGPIRIVPLPNDRDGEISKEVRRQLRQAGFVVEEIDNGFRRLMVPSPLERGAGPELVLRGNIEEIVTTPPSAARLRWRLQGQFTGEANPRFDRTWRSEPDSEILRRELTEQAVWVIPHQVPQLGGTPIHVDQQLLVTIPIALAMLGVMIRRSRSRFWAALSATGYCLAVFWVIGNRDHSSDLIQFLEWSLLLAGTVCLVGVEDLMSSVSTARNRELPVRSPRLLTE